MKYIIYCRKSTESDDRQVLSIESQEGVLLELAKNNNWEIFKTYKESKSAKQPNRPVFNEMMSLFEKDKDEYTVLVWNLDRLARNSVDGGLLIYYLDQKFISEIKTHDKVFKNNPDDKMMMSLVFGFAKKYVDDLSINVKRGNKTKMEKGGWPALAPFGYLNDKITKEILVDKTNASYIKRCFELSATGRYTLKDIADIMQSEGMRSLKGATFRKGNILRILRNTFYYGLMQRGLNTFQGNHEPIVSKQLFDDVQNTLDRKSHFKKQKNFFHLRGLFTCASCGCSLTATQKKGHDYYYCTNGKNICLEHKTYLRGESLDVFIARLLEKLNIDKELIEIIYQAVKEKIKYNQGANIESKENLVKQLASLEKKQEALLDNFVAMTTPKALYASKMKKFSDDQISLEQQLANLQENEGKESLVVEKVKSFLLNVCTLKEKYLKSLPEKKNIIANHLLWNLTIANQKLVDFKPKEPYGLLLCGAKIDDSENLRRRWDSNPRAPERAEISNLLQYRYATPPITIFLKLQIPLFL